MMNQYEVSIFIGLIVICIGLIISDRYQEDLRDRVCVLEGGKVIDYHSIFTYNDCKVNE